MILVILGTQDKPFKRLLKAVEKQIELSNIQEEVIVQAGSTKFKSDKMKILDYISIEEFKKIVQKADLIITHAGVGSILTGLKYNKKIIAAARLKKYGEHVNDHQEQILENFYERGYILKLENFNKLDEVLEESKEFKPKKFKENNNIFMEKMEDEINNYLGKITM